MRKLLFTSLLFININVLSQSSFWVGGPFWFGVAPGPTTGSTSFFIVSGVADIPSGSIVNNIEVSSGAACTFTGDVTLNNRLDVFGSASVLGNTTINGTIGGSGTFSVFPGAQLIQIGTSANTNANCQVSTGLHGGANAYNFISSPVASTKITGQFGGSNPCDMFVFQAGDQDWGWDIEPGPQTCNGVGVIFDAGNSIPGADGIMDIARGYTVSGGINPTYSGVLNNGTKNISLSSGPVNPDWSGNSWNLIGNPYPSAVDADAFITGNGSISGTLYFWDDDNSGGGGYDETDDYATYTLAGGVSSNSGIVPNGSIGVGQGFFVSGTGTATFTNSMRGGNNSQFFKAQKETVKRVWLKAINADGFTSSLLLAFTDSASLGFDRGYDGERFVQKQKLLFGTQINEEGCYIIQCQNNISEITDRVIDVMLRVTEDNTVSISLDHFEDFYPNKEIILLDTETGKLQNLSDAPFAVYLKAYQNYDGRFKIIIRENSIVTGVYKYASSQVKTIVNNELLTIDFNGQSYRSVSMFNVNGQTIMSNNTSGKSNLTYPVDQLDKGIYFLRFIDLNNRHTTKRVGIY